MSKEIRGKRVDNGEWVYGDLIGANRTYILTKEQKKYMVVSSGYMCSVELTEVIPETVGQCTGLKDKNGTLIFENSNAIYCSESLNYKGVIKYDLQYLYWYFEYKTVDCNGFTWTEKLDFTETESNEYEIIGTIHDKEK
jgi:uncharacterized phage protein (TIGR01671 family)